MLKVVNVEAPKTRKLILGFDAGCGTCADLAAGVQERVGDNLEVQNLNDPQLMAWREEALGKDAKWTPTLFEVEGEKVLKAWAGWRMGYALSRKLGPSSTWQVMQALGEVGGAPKVEESAIVEKLPEKAAEAVVGMSRGQFLKGVGGAAVAMSVLSRGVLAAPASAATRSPWDSVKQTKVTGTERLRVASSVGRGRDVINLVGGKFSTTARVKAAHPTVVRHRLRNGSIMLAISYIVSRDTILVFRVHQARTPRSLPRQMAGLHHIVVRNGSVKSMTLVKASEEGQLWRKPSVGRLSAQGEGIEPLAYCPPVGGSQPTLPPNGGFYDRCKGTQLDPDGNGFYPEKVCGSRDYGCAFIYCAGGGAAGSVVCRAIPAGTALFGPGGLLATVAACAASIGGPCYVALRPKSTACCRGELVTVYRPCKVGTSYGPGAP